jgi:hypothetical protein
MKVWAWNGMKDSSFFVWEVRVRAEADSFSDLESESVKSRGPEQIQNTFPFFSTLN